MDGGQRIDCGDRIDRGYGGDRGHAGGRSEVPEGEGCQNRGRQGGVGEGREGREDDEGHRTCGNRHGC
ncbi:hypothetical protein GCM10027187_12660 [Streptosporangium sandarakinum]